MEVGRIESECRVPKSWRHESDFIESIFTLGVEWRLNLVKLNQDIFISIPFSSLETYCEDEG